MGDPIYTVDPKTKRSVKIEAVSFGSIGISERADLEQWIIKHPDILGEPLLILTSEFSAFDRSNKRLDILALDEEGVITVIELKLATAGTHADLQAIRYAAFCSMMTMQEMIRIYAVHSGISEDAAERSILDFLKKDELPELNNTPRIIIAAGSIDDQELTSSVLWLRRFGIDISCVEITPYRISNDDQIILVPKTVIPLPETKGYQVRVENKAVASLQVEKTRVQNHELWREVGKIFNEFPLDLKAPQAGRGRYMQLTTGIGAIHYEWMQRKRDKCIDVAIHFETDDIKQNESFAEPFKDRARAIEEGVGLPFKVDAWGEKWWQARFSVPWNEEEPIQPLAHRLATVMRTLVERTRSMVEALRGTKKAR